MFNRRQFLASNSRNPRPGWAVAKWAAFGVWLVAAAANVAEIRAGFLTNYAADLAVPAWLYIVAREQTIRGRQSRLMPWIGRSPALTAEAIFVASALTEVCQHYWPKGLFAGTFDPLDIVAFGIGVSACYLAEQRWPMERNPSAQSRRE